MGDYLNTVEYLRTTGSTAGSESALPVVGQGVYNRALLERSLPNLMHMYFGQQKSMSRSNGMSMVFRRYESLAQATVPLADGVTPPGVRLTKTDYTATLTQYGNWTSVSDNVDLFHVDSVIAEASEILGENMGESLDTVVREVLVAGTNLYRVATDDSGTFATHADRTSVYGTICKSVLDRAIRALKAENAKPFVPEIPASVKVNTYPLPAAFWCLIHPDQEADLYAANGGFWNATNKTLDGFIPVQNYAGSQGVMPNEIGAYRNIRFVTSTNVKIWAGGGASGSGLRETSNAADVYGSLIFAKDAYGVIKPDAAMSGVITHKAGGPGDPLNQRNTVGWKAWIACVILMQENMVRIECGTIA